MSKKRKRDNDPLTFRPFRRTAFKCFPDQIAEKFFDEIAAGLKAIGARHKDLVLRFLPVGNGVTVMQGYIKSDLSLPVFTKQWPPGDVSPVPAYIEIFGKAPDDLEPRGQYESGEAYGHRLRKAESDLREVKAYRVKQAFDALDFKLANGRITFDLDGFRIDVTIPEAKALILPPDKAAQVCRAIRIIEQDHADAFEAHCEAINALNSLSAAKAYDASCGWPGENGTVYIDPPPPPPTRLKVYRNPDWGSD